MSKLLKALQAKLDSYVCKPYTAICYGLALEYPAWTESRVCDEASLVHNKLWLADESKRKVLRIAITRETENIAIRDAHLLIGWGKT